MTVRKAIPVKKSKEPQNGVKEGSPGKGSPDRGNASLGKKELARSAGVRTGIGQDSHRFLPPGSSKLCVIAGCIFEEMPGFSANSDGDIAYHAICNAISSLTHVLILGGIADELCLKDGITDSEVYLLEAMKTLGEQRVTHVALTIEAKKPVFKKRLLEMRMNIARVMGLDIAQVGITATSGEGLTDFGCGDGAQCFAIVTTEET